MANCAFALASICIDRAEGWDLIAEGWDLIAEGWDLIAEGWDLIAEGWELTALVCGLSFLALYALISDLTLAKAPFSTDLLVVIFAIRPPQPVWWEPGDFQENGLCGLRSRTGSS